MSQPSFPSVRVNRKAAARAAAGHPWLFRSDIEDHGSAQPGDTVQVLDPRSRSIGVAHYSSTSQITLRLLSPRLQSVDRSFYLQRLQTALAFRERAVAHSDSYRLVHGEADGLPGLVVDRYNDCLTIQTLTQAMARAQPDILSCLEELIRPRAIVARNDVAVRSREALPVESGIVAGTLDGPVPIQFNGFQLEADLLAGQKTGVYLDQRENYAACAAYARGRALDCFCNTGGFALHLTRHCDSVEGIDSSTGALATAARNANRNGVTNVEWREAEVFQFLTQSASARRSYDCIVLDPPAFTKSRGAIEGALRGYKEINQRALRMLAPGGILISCSCSHHVSEAMLLEVIAEAALDTRRTLIVRERRMQAADHPVLLTVPETYYLKCLVLEVTPTS